MVYIAANPPSPVPEEEEVDDDSSPRSEVICGEKSSPTFDTVSYAINVVVLA